MKWLYWLAAMLPLSLLAQKKNARPVAISQPAPFASVDARSVQWPDSVTVSVEKLGNYVNSHFADPTEKAQAIFVWIADNIQYDVDNMFALDFYADPKEKINKPLRTRKGICENYAALFTAVCIRAGIRSVVVEGYTKQRGFVDFIPHAWCAAYLDDGWWLFDPTWGSGFVDHGRFVRKMNEEYFKATPAVFVRSHMPFDYLWQFVNYPLTNQEFYEGKTELDRSKPYFDYPDSTIRKMIDDADRLVQSAKSGAGALDTTYADARQRASFQSLNEAIATASAHVKEQQDWLKEYFSKSKIGRKSMFYKVTLFGKPVN